MTSKRFLILSVVVGIATFLQAQQPNSEPEQKPQPTFKEHRIGESAQEFFAIAKMANKNGMLSTDYCRSYLAAPKVKKAVAKAQAKGWNSPALLAVGIDVEGCNHINAALAGKDVEVDSRYAAEFGNGGVQFIAGHLASVRFVVKAPFDNVVEDMNAKLNAQPQLDVATLQNGVAAIQKQHRATWTLSSIHAKVSELQSLEGNDIGTEVSVSSPAIEHRANSLN